SLLPFLHPDLRLLSPKESQEPRIVQVDQLGVVSLQCAECGRPVIVIGPNMQNSIPGKVGQDILNPPRTRLIPALVLYSTRSSLVNLSQPNRCSTQCCELHQVLRPRVAASLNIQQARNSVNFQHKIESPRVAERVVDGLLRRQRLHLMLE